ncbi:unnamed protein product [Paramecium octaurelia]|uniref:Uncharacterized protein n=1 Tax=Paramecium octaurelia TaxID=43137 RepID=A0A8S1UFV7_PAROT|nr:unnamed protein product [Paramecium octaurelia]
MKSQLKHPKDVHPRPSSSMEDKEEAQMECVDIQRGQELIRGKKVRFRTKEPLQILSGLASQRRMLNYLFKLILQIQIILNCNLKIKSYSLFIFHQQIFLKVDLV